MNFTIYGVLYYCKTFITRNTSRSFIIRIIIGKLSAIRFGTIFTIIILIHHIMHTWLALSTTMISTIPIISDRVHIPIQIYYLITLTLVNAMSFFKYSILSIEWTTFGAWDPGLTIVISYALLCLFTDLHNVVLINIGSSC